MVRPATIVGNANGRSTRALNRPCPMKRSRTSVHAIAVPATALTSATTSETPSVSLRAEVASAFVTACQPCAFQLSAARGSSTMRLR